MELTDDEVRRFAEACADPRNDAARQAMAGAGATSATGVVARLLLAPSAERRRLVALVRRAIRS